MALLPLKMPMLIKSEASKIRVSMNNNGQLSKTSYVVLPLLGLKNRPVRRVSLVTQEQMELMLPWLQPPIQSGMQAILASSTLCMTINRWLLERFLWSIHQSILILGTFIFSLSTLETWLVPTERRLFESIAGLDCRDLHLSGGLVS